MNTVKLGPAIFIMTAAVSLKAKLFSSTGNADSNCKKGLSSGEKKKAPSI